MVTGTTTSITYWNSNKYCPKCNSNNGYNDSDMFIYSDKKNNYCEDCESYWKKSDIITYEQMINNKRSEKLKIILE
jgi:NAD-dependent SIR2 family protein deacetylase